MPQLNPTPWFFTMLISWLAYALLIQPKILKFVTANPPSSKAPTAPSTSPWNWPWT